MRIAGFIIILSVCLLAACGGKNRPPGHILSPDKMEAVLWDMMRADQFLFTYVLPQDSTKKKLEESQKLYSQIFQLHKVSEEEFRESFAWYKTHPKFLVPVMDSIATHSNNLTAPAPADPAAPAIPVPVADTTNPPAAPAVQPGTNDTIQPRRPKKMIEVN